MTEMHDNAVKFGKSAYEIVQEYLDPLSIPYYIGFPTGHQDLNLALYLGVEVCMEVGEDGALKLEYLINNL
jgi:muramoyltetrapeptide carboxypeptidase